MFDAFYRLEPMWQDYEAVANRFDVIDHIIDLNGHIIGMCLSPDHRFLHLPQIHSFVNHRLILNCFGMISPILNQ